MGRSGGVGDAPDDVEIGQRGLDHDHVRALLHVEQRLAHRLAPVGRIHLVAAPVAERGRRVGRLAERAVEGRGELRAVGEDRHVREALGVERGADRADAAVHHVARRDDVRAGARLADGRAREQLERRVVVDRLAVQHAAVPVARVLAQAEVGDHEQVGVRGVDRADRLLDDAVVVPGAGALLVLGAGMPNSSTAGMPSAATAPASVTAAATGRRETPGHRLDRRRRTRSPPRRTAASRGRRPTGASRARDRAAPECAAGAAGGWRGRPSSGMVGRADRRSGSRHARRLSARLAG